MKTMDEIYQEMLACFGERTGMGLSQSCDLSARLYALAAQVYSLYIQADWVKRQAFPQSAEGEYLDYHARMRGLERKKATAAGGVVRFLAGEARESNRVIPQGTVCMTAGLVRFATARQAVLPAGEMSVDVPVEALTLGVAGNVAAGTIVSMAVAPVGILACTNPEACTGGSDEESDEELRQRILDTFQRLPNGANAAFYEQEALSFDEVAAAAVLPRPRGVGTVDVVVASQAGLPGEELLQELSEYFRKRREIAVDVQVRAPQTSTVDVAIQVAAREGADAEQVKAAVEQALREQFTGKLLGQDVLLAWLGNLVYGCQGVANYVLTAPTADLLVAEDVLPVLGSVTVEAMA